MSEKMIQAVVVEANKVELHSVEMPFVDAGGVLVRVETCGLCGSDLAMISGAHPVIRPPLVPGHEVIGEIVRLGSAVTGFEVGDRVAMLPQTGCGECAACRRDEARLCPEMKLIGGQRTGGLAEYLVIPQENLVALPDSVPSELRPLVEPLAVAVHAVRRRAPRPGERTVVLGGGPIGTLVALTAKKYGASVTVVEPVENRRATVEMLGLSAVEAVDDVRDADIVFECVGGAAAPVSALETARSGGHVVLVGVSARELAFDGVLLQRQERTVSGTNMYDREDFHEAFWLLAERLIPKTPEILEKVFTVRSLSQVPQTIDDLMNRRLTTLKTVIIP